MITPPPKKNSLLSKTHHVDHLRTQHEHLLVLQQYLQWMSKRHDPKIRSKYEELIDLLEQSANQYASLIKMLQKQIDHE